MPLVNTGRIRCLSPRTIFMGLPRLRIRIWREPPPHPHTDNAISAPRHLSHYAFNFLSRTGNWATARASHTLTLPFEHTHSHTCRHTHAHTQTQTHTHTPKHKFNPFPRWSLYSGELSLTPQVDVPLECDTHTHTRRKKFLTLSHTNTHVYTVFTLACKCINTHLSPFSRINSHSLSFPSFSLSHSLSHTHSHTLTLTHTHTQCKCTLGE